MDRVNVAIGRIRNEPALLVAAVVAGLNAATVQTWQGYVAAGLTGLLRFVVYGPDSVEG